MAIQKENDYPSILCTYCRYTNYGESPCEYNSPLGYHSCEGDYCEEAYEDYMCDNPDEERTLEEMF